MALLLLLACPGAVAQRLFVETTSYSALHEATEVRLYAADLGNGTTLPALPPLPGNVAVGPLLLSADSKAVIALSGRWPAGRDAGTDSARGYAAAFGATTLQPLTNPPLSLPSGWTPVSTLTVADEAGHSVPVILSARLEDGVWRGRMDVYELTSDGAPSAESVSWPLPGAPVAGVALGSEGEIAVLCKGGAGPDPLLHIRNVFTGQVSLEALALPGATGNGKAEPTGLVAAPNGAGLYVLISGYVFDRPSGGSATWLYRIDAARPALVAAPLELPGTADVDAPPAVTADGGCWVSTWEVASGFAYATKAVPGTEGMSTEAQVPFMEMEGPLRLAVAPQGVSVAVAADERLEIWPEGRPTGAPTSFAAPIRVVRWSDEGLFVGEGNRLHVVAPNDPSSKVTVSLQAGVVNDFVVLPDDVPAGADTDEDGIADAADPLPATPSPRLSLPSVITLHGESVGQETRAVLVDPAFGKGLMWRVELDPATAQWLRVYPTEGKAGEPFYLGVDEAHYPAQRALLQGVMTVTVADPQGNTPVAGSPAKVRVQVLPQPGDEPLVLWVLDREGKTGSLQDESDPYQFRALAGLLSGNPHRFVHREAHGAFLESLSSYRVVVISAKAAAQGAVTRQALLNYVEEGGAVLFLCSSLEDREAQALTRWLSPLNVYIDSKVRVDGTYSTNRPHWLCRHWKSFNLSDGAGIRADNPDSTLVPGPAGSGALVAQSYGRGRIAVLAAATPIQSAALGEREHQRFASDLFRWLARNGTEMEDVDGDGLPDRGEDANANGIWDPGETDRFNADSDGDGIPDGREDVNYNGRVDEGETHPLNADTDGDGIQDGADVEALPVPGTPHVQAVSPSSAPAEGGVAVVVSGRNFKPGCTLWFGDRAAQDVQRLGETVLSATAPPADADGTVAIRVVDPAKDLTGVLPRGFLYTPRSRVRIRIESVYTAPSSLEGVLAVRLSAPAGVPVGRVSLRLEADASNTLHWTDVSIGSGARAAGRQVQTRPHPTGGMWIDVSPANVSAAPGQLAIVRWQADEPLDDVHVTVAAGHVAAGNGEPLPFTANELVLTAAE